MDEFHTDHLVTVNDDEVIITSSLSTLVSLPELEDIQCIGIGSYCDHQNDHADADNITTPTANTNNKKLHSPRGRWTSSPRTRTSTSPRSPKDVVTCSPTIQHKLLCQSVSSIVSPIYTTNYDDDMLYNQIMVEDERTVLFHEESLGIKISRCADGYVRVLSVTPPSRSSSSSPNFKSVVLAGDTNIDDTDTDTKEHDREASRTGEIYEGDIIRQVSDVNLRTPIDTAVWKLTVGLIKMSPRPLKFVVAKELLLNDNEEVKEKDDGVLSSCKQQQQQKTGRRNYMGFKSGSEERQQRHQQPDRSRSEQTTQEQSQHQHQTISSTINSGFKTRTINFHEAALGVKLHHSTSGQVKVLSVTPYKSFPNSPGASSGSIDNEHKSSSSDASRSGDEIYEGDIVLEVRGSIGSSSANNDNEGMRCWNLLATEDKPIDAETWWCELIMFIRESDRPLCMVVTEVVI